MKDDNYNSHPICKAMQNSALKQIVEELKKFVEYGCVHKSDLFIILNSMEDVISTYNCVPCDCLEKRLNTLKEKFSGISEIDIKIFISEIETFLNYDSNFDITLKNNSSHKI